MNPPLPTGAVHEVGPSELFFSTTDAKGVITQANSVFVRLSRYERDALIGAPHNIIRHPSMPGGAFLLMWETLKAGRPFCAYVDNLAADGSRYTVFATITPLGDDYLSVRLRPRRTDLLDAAGDLYGMVRPHELQFREQGASAHDAAVSGLGELAQLLADAGFASYDEFIRVALPAEVRLRADDADGFPTRPEAVGSLADLLAAATRLHGHLLTWIDALDDLQDLADALVAGGARLQETIESSERTAGEFTDAVSAQEGFAPILGSVTLWAQMIGEIDTHMLALADRLAALRMSAADTRFRIALGGLQCEAVGQFAAELIDEVPGHEAARPAIVQLVRALREGVLDAATAMEANAHLSAEVADDIDLLADLLSIPTGLLEGWRDLAAGRQDPVIEQIMPRVAEVVSGSDQDREALSGLAGRCRGVRPLDPGPLHAELDVIERVTSTL